MPPALRLTPATRLPEKENLYVTRVTSGRP
jgi:hypothetical protein